MRKWLSHTNIGEYYLCHRNGEEAARGDEHVPHHQWHCTLRVSLIKEGTLLLFSVVEVRDALGHEQIEGAERDGAALERQIAHFALFWACARLDIEYSTTRSSSDRSCP